MDICDTLFSLKYASQPNGPDFLHHGHHQMLLINLLLDKMAAFLQMIFSDAFSWMKSFVFW